MLKSVMNAVNKNTTGINLNVLQKHNLMAVICAIVLLFAIVFSLSPIFANADNVSDAQSEVDAANTTLDQAQAEYQNVSSQASQLQAEIQETTQRAFAAQEELLNKQDSLNTIATKEYKNGSSLPFVGILLSSNSIDEFVKNLDYCNRIMKAKTDAINDQKQAKSNFDSILSELSNKSDELNNLLASSASKKAEAEKKLGDAQSKLESEKASQQNSSNPTPSPSPSPSPVGPDVGSWSSGTASAYNSGTTATGAPVTESSMGIAVPMSLPNYKSLFGHTVMIKIGGTTVIGTVNDCGGLEGGARCMDVQPGIYHAFGYGSASAWGLRHVEYKIL